MALHWIIHNKPYMLDIGRIFDDVRVLPNGSHMGGEGKVNMYILHSNVVLQDLEFIESPLLTELVRKLFHFFQSLAHFNYDRPTSQDVEDAGKLKNCKTIRKLVKDAANRDGWPVVCDKATTDIYEGIDSVDGVGKGKTDSTDGSISTEASIDSSGNRASKRSLDEDNDVTQPKPPKISKTR
jgi:hypothetical protein